MWNWQSKVPVPVPAKAKLLVHIKFHLSLQKKKKSLPFLALACDRTVVSERTTAIITSSLSKGVGIISSNDTSGVIDRSKLRLERTKVRSALQNADRDKMIRGIYFDGRKDKTLVSIQKEGKFYKKSYRRPLCDFVGARK
ncbi:hypothetical protein EVAR_86477_1 [Eumeta japonica]|uniref:Uncharacterized protein n=1 Tax=Eumeta variegata TaxID=151549 RepID=A0A4C1VNT8_EUMVA|nr:hypothetical protein EVAR_86477_1 [Eumeta japonica]